MNTVRSRQAIALLVATVAVLAVPASSGSPRPQQSHADLRAAAERLHAEGSFARALQQYEQLGRQELPPAERRWVEFRIADSTWRSEAATQAADMSRFDAARKRLETLVSAIERPSDRDLVWAEAHESLADFWWTRRDQQNWGQAWPHYEMALGFWAGSTDLDLARQRYLGMVDRMARPAWRGPDSWGRSGHVPLAVLDNALEIASAAERPHLNYLLAQALQYQGGTWRQRLRILDAFEGALAGGRANDWYDDALFFFGQWLESQGRVIRLKDGQWRQEPDYRRAVEIYKRLVSEFAKGESQYVDDAQAHIAAITEPSVGAAVSNIFLPGSQIELNLSWRNLKSLDVAIYGVDLVKAVDFKPRIMAEKGTGNWTDHIAIGEKPLRSWTVATEDDGEHRPGQRVERLEEPLEAGAYVLVASAGPLKARELILVSDAAAVVKADSEGHLVYVCDALSGAPIKDADVRVWAMWTDGSNKWLVRDKTVRTDEQGLARVSAADLGTQNIHTQLFVTARAGHRQALASAHRSPRDDGGWPWRLYAFTDRPAYRPDETMHWKFTARRDRAGEQETPAGASILWRLQDPHGTKVAEGTSQLNDFGSAWGDLALTSQMMLGEYSMVFHEAKNPNAVIGSARLFRLEEYKLPEFQVSLQTPRDPSGRRKAFRVGDVVEAEIVAEYFFGGPVANADVQAVIYQKPFFHWWWPRREFAWCYGPNDRPDWYGQGQVVDQRTLKTDGNGRATLRFETPEWAQQDFEYTIEARVTDASRREIIGRDSVRVTRQLYYVHPRPASHLYQPGDTVQIDVKAIDANDQPVQVKGTMTVYREQWKEIWVDPVGRDLPQAEQDRLAANPTAAAAGGFRLRFRGYESEKITEEAVQTDAQGEAVFRFVPAREGFYRCAWRSPDTLEEDDTWFGDWITAEAMVWVLNDKSRAIGYRHGGVDIVADRDTFKVGQSAAVMIATPTNGRHVLFSVEGDLLHDVQVIHVPGQVRLVRVPVRQAHVPNVFLNAAMVWDGQLFADREEIVVPPLEHYLDVTVSADREVYEPQETGTLTVKARTHEGKPVVAELALAVFDESVTYIQADIAGDPREFFFTRRQEQRVGMGSTFEYRPFRKLLEEARDEKEGDDRMVPLEEGRFDRDGGGGRGRRASGMGGGALFGDVVDGISAAQAPAAARELGFADGRLGMELSKNEAFSGVPGSPAAGAPAEPVRVRTDFRSTLLWLPDLRTDEDGTATVEVRYADALTRWKAVARGGTSGNQFGIGSVTTRTRKPLIARLQAPRFFVAGDSVTISAVLNNNTEEALDADVTLEAAGLKLLGVRRGGRIEPGERGRVSVPAGADARIDWLVEAQTSGEAKLRLTARAGKHSDAMEKTYPVHEHGIEKLLVASGAVRGDDLTLRLDIPAARRLESTVLSVQVSPSMAVTMLDALPYLIDYPYGCTEQTMSRFLPAAITAKTLRDLGLDGETAMGRVFGGIDQETARKSHPKGRRNLAELDEMVRQGLERLTDFQHGDGGWGWWKDGDSDRFMSAYILWGLSLALAADLPVDAGVLERGARFLETGLVEEEFNHDRQAWMLHALSSWRQAAGRGDSGPLERKAFDNLYKNRDKLNTYTRALLALSAQRSGRSSEAKILVENLVNGVKIDKRPDTSILLGQGRGGQAPNPAVIATAHWGADGVWWRWSDGPVETTAFALQAILAVDPKHELVEPVMNWLVKNRRGAHWSNTRDTAIAVLMLNDYLRASGELEADLDYELSVNGTVVENVTIRPSDVLSAPSRFTIDPALVRNGPSDIRIRRTRGSKGPLYVAAEARFFSLEEPITPAGSEIFLRRDYHRLAPTPTLLNGLTTRRIHLSDEDYLTSGERVEVIVTIEAKNDYEYLVLEDLKPAGLEAVALRSGEGAWARELRADTVERAFAPGAEGAAAADVADATGDGQDGTGRMVSMHQELRDRHVAFFIDRLPQGTWEIRYELRAEVPGHYHALPVLGHAMYVPEIRANGAEIRMTVND